jgi:hypothetical protein
MSEKKLRDSLAELVDMLDRAGYVSTQEWLDGEERARKALAEAGEPEMVRLLQRITKPAYEVVDEHGQVWWTMPKEVLDRIFAEFGYILPEAGDDHRTLHHNRFLGWLHLCSRNPFR